MILPAFATLLTRNEGIIRKRNRIHPSRLLQRNIHPIHRLPPSLTQDNGVGSGRIIPTAWRAGGEGIVIGCIRSSMPSGKVAFEGGTAEGLEKHDFGEVLCGSTA